MHDVELKVSVVTKLLAWDSNYCHFLLSFSKPFSPLPWDETILTITAPSSSAQKAQLSSAFTVKLVEFGEKVDNLKPWSAVLSFFSVTTTWDFQELQCSSHRFTC